MESNALLNPIPYEVADQLCAEIRAKAEREWHTLTARWCWHCQETTGGDMTRRGFLRAPGNRGCILINARYAELQHALSIFPPDKIEKPPS